MKILVVEDDEDLAGLIARYLQPIADSVPVIARTMAEALNIISRAEPINLVTLDLTLPDSGRDESRAKIREFKSMQPDCMVIVLTGSMKPDEEAASLAAGADGFMQKAICAREQGTFLTTLNDVFRSIARQPVRYQKNIPLLERLTAKIELCSKDFCPLSSSSPKSN